jgi:uncharacterized protein (DUF2147 family)
VYGVVKQMRVALALAAALLAAVAACLAQTAAGLEGIWLTEDGAAKIRFEPCGSMLCGRLVWLREPNDPQTGRAILDKHNPDPALRTRQLLGIALFTDVTPLRLGEWHAVAYNAENAGSYDVTLTLTAPNALALRGCGLAGLVCRTERWTRAVP